ncbi:MAG TPA: 4Fe-4S binding protein [Clostridiaceae bacterium]|nr:4Fe-4S binding protein [Clostridiaceae bacterium]
MSFPTLQLRRLGKTNLQLSFLGLGTLTVSPAQNNLSDEAAGEILAYAVKRGINWLDTAHLYDNYSQIRAALNRLATPPHIMTKTYAYAAADAERDFNTARRKLGLDQLAAVMLHEQENPLTLSGHREAFGELLARREKGEVAAVGISTHSVSVVESLADVKYKAAGSNNCALEPNNFATGEYIDEGVKSEGRDLIRDMAMANKKRLGNYPELPDCYQETDFIFPLLNQTGIGLLEGSWQQMATASKFAAHVGLGVLGMKLFAGGHLLSQRLQAITAALDMDFVTAWSVGMGTEAEIDINIDWFCGREPSEKMLRITEARPRRLVIEDWCIGCGNCVARCRSGALSLCNGQVSVDQEKCILCSYCASSCPLFAIKIW